MQTSPIKAYVSSVVLCLGHIGMLTFVMHCIVHTVSELVDSRSRLSDHLHSAAGSCQVALQRHAAHDYQHEAYQTVPCLSAYPYFAFWMLAVFRDTNMVLSTNIVAIKITVGNNNTALCNCSNDTVVVTVWYPAPICYLASAATA